MCSSRLARSSASPATWPRDSPTSTASTCAPGPLRPRRAADPRPLRLCRRCICCALTGSGRGGAQHAPRPLLEQRAAHARAARQDLRLRLRAAPERGDLRVLDHLGSRARPAPAASAALPFEPFAQTGSRARARPARAARAARGAAQARPRGWLRPFPPPSLRYKVDTSRPSPRTDWTRLVPFPQARQRGWLRSRSAARRFRSRSTSGRSASSSGPPRRLAAPCRPAPRRPGCARARPHARSGAMTARASPPRARHREAPPPY